jgi:hypothetical protein
MFGKLRTSHLLLIVAALAALWWITGQLSPTAKQRTFREDILQVDTSALSSFIIVPALYKGLPPMHFMRQGRAWEAALLQDTTVVDMAPLRDLLGSLAHMRALRMAGSMSTVAEHYELSDSTAEHLLLDLPDGRYDLLVGRCTGGDDPVTVVSPSGDPNAYGISGRLGTYTDQSFGDWMPKYLVNGDPRNWTSVQFTFPGDTGYTMVRSGSTWLLDGLATDTARVRKFLRSLARSRAQEVADPADTLHAVPAFRLLVNDTTREEAIAVVVYNVPGRFIVRTSLNPGVVMNFDGTTEVPRMFRSRLAFLPQQE